LIICFLNSLYSLSHEGTTPETSAIRLWSTATWESLGVIQAHTLTVTQMAFSHDDRYLLTVSRDRQFCLLEKVAQPGTGAPYRIVTTKAKAHARILWGCDWTHDDVLFATVARDQTAKVWTGNASSKLVTTIDLASPATAVAFAPKAASAQKYVLAVGEEDGRISLWSGGVEGKWEQSLVIPSHIGHVSVVRRLRWQQKKAEKAKDDKEKNEKNRYLLATCSYDWSVRLFSLSIP